MRRLPPRGDPSRAARRIHPGLSPPSATPGRVTGRVNRSRASEGARRSPSRSRRQASVPCLSASPWRGRHDRAADGGIGIRQGDHHGTDRVGGTAPGVVLGESGDDRERVGRRRMGEPVAGEVIEHLQVVPGRGSRRRVDKAAIAIERPLRDLLGQRECIAVGPAPGPPSSSAPPPVPGARGRREDPRRESAARPRDPPARPEPRCDGHPPSGA